MKKLVKPLQIKYVPPVAGQAASPGYWVYKPVYEYYSSGGWTSSGETAECYGTIVVTDDDGTTYVLTSYDPNCVPGGTHEYVRVTYVRDYWVPAQPYIAAKPAQYLNTTHRGFDDYALSVAQLTADKITVLELSGGARARVVDSSTEAPLYTAELLGGTVTAPGVSQAHPGTLRVMVMPSDGATYVWLDGVAASLRVLTGDDVKAYGAPYDENSYVLASEEAPIALATLTATAEVDMTSSAALAYTALLDMTALATPDGTVYIEATAELDLRSIATLDTRVLLSASAQIDMEATAEVETFSWGDADLRLAHLAIGGATKYQGDFATALAATLAAPYVAMTQATVTTTATGGLLADLRAVYGNNSASIYDYAGTLVHTAFTAANYGLPTMVSSVYATNADSYTSAALLAAIQAAADTLTTAGYGELAAELVPGSWAYVLGVARDIVEALQADPALAAYAQQLADAIAAMAAYVTHDPLVSAALALYVAAAASIAAGTASENEVLAFYAAGAAAGLENGASVTAAAAAFYDYVTANELDAGVLAMEQYVALAAAYSALQGYPVTVGTGTITVGGTSPAVGRQPSMSLSSDGEGTPGSSFTYGGAALSFGSAGRCAVGGIASGAARTLLFARGLEDSSGSYGVARGLSMYARGVGAPRVPGAVLPLRIESIGMVGGEVSVSSEYTHQLSIHGGLEVGGQTTYTALVILPINRGGLAVGGQTSVMVPLKMAIHGGLAVGGTVWMVRDTLVMVINPTSDRRGNPLKALTRLNVGRIKKVLSDHTGQVYILTDDGLYSLTGPHMDGAAQMPPAYGRQVRLNGAVLEGKGTMKVSAQAKGKPEHQYTAPLDPTQYGKVRVVVGRGIVGQQLDTGIRTQGDAEVTALDTEIIDV